MAKARRALETSKEDRANGFSARADFRVSVAQVQATLAVAEQLRIGNLMAFGHFRAELPDGAAIFTGMDGIVSLRNYVGEALGIDVDGSVR